MSNYNYEDVKVTFGSHFEQYCKRHRIYPEKDKSGAFMVSDISVLKECRDVIDKSKNALNCQLKQIQRYRPSSSSSNQHKHWRKPFVQNKARVKKSHGSSTRKRYATDRLDPFFANMRLDIFLFDTPSILPSRPVCNMSTDYILNTAQTGKEIYEFIIKETLKDTVIVDYEASIPLASSALEQFQKKHKKFHYYSVLKNLTQSREHHEKLRYTHEVVKKQLKAFFELVLHKVVPLHILGKSKNVKKIKWAIFDFLNISSYKPFNLKAVIKKLDILSVSWLKPIENKTTQWLIFAKFIKWFFNGFIIKILRTHFHITSLSASSNERVYIRRNDWCTVQKRFMRQKIRSNTLQPDIKLNEWNPPVGVYKLLPKNSGLRPLFIAKHKEAEKRDINTVFKFLKQLFCTKYGTTNFHGQWRPVCERNHNTHHAKFHLVSCDVKDAFGSIIQDTLYDIIRSFCENLPETMTLQYCGLERRDNRNRYSDDFYYKQYFMDKNLLLPFRPGTLYTRADYMGRQCIQKSWLLSKIRKYICYQRVNIRNKIYVIGKGIAQGMMFSPVLSDIYYSFVLQKHLAIFMESGAMIRYMDDLLFATENIELAKEFFEVTKKGISQYNCQFKQQKTQSNIIGNGYATVNNIGFIGYKIDCSTLEVEPELPDKDIHHFISFSSKENFTPLLTFRKKICNISSLKLSKFVLDRVINSEPKIIMVLQKASLLQAMRAHVLIQELFPNIKKHVRSILKIIKTSNKIIARHVLRSFIANGQRIDKVEMCRWNQKILSMLHISYKRVFKKNKILQRKFKTICVTKKKH